MVFIDDDDFEREPLMAGLSQEWMTRRLGPIEPADVQRNLHIVSLTELTPPQAWRNVWTGYFGDGPSPLPSLITEKPELDAILILSNPYDEIQCGLLAKSICAYNACGLDGPVLIWVPHSLAPEVGMDTQQDIAMLARPLLQEGLDALLEDEPAGWSLALALNVKINSLEILADRVAQQLRRRHLIQERAQMLKKRLHCLVWEYYREKSCSSIPKVDPQIPAGNTAQLPGYDVGSMLGRGAYGTVRMLRAQEADQETQTGDPSLVVKIVDKSSILGVDSIQKVRREMDIMKSLAGEWSHPNVVGMHSILCSETHVFLVMDYAGSLNLYRRLAYRELLGDRCRPLSMSQSRSLMEQAMAAVGHLHLGPQVCHRDIKPENFVVDEVDGQPIVMKLTDFDVSCFQRNDSLCSSMCGTTPFIAPEVLLQKTYNGRAADIWSLGVVLLEILCCVRILEKGIGISSCDNNDGPGPEFAKEVVSTFSDSAMVGELLHYYTRSELVELHDPSLPILQGMLTVDAQKRWDTHQVVTSVQTLSLSAREH